MVCWLCKWCEQRLGKLNDHCHVFVLSDAQLTCYLSLIFVNPSLFSTVLILLPSRWHTIFSHSHLWRKLFFASDKNAVECPFTAVWSTVPKCRALIRCLALMWRDRCFPRNVEFLAELWNLPVSPQFLCFRRIFRNLLLASDKRMNMEYFGRVQTAVENNYYV